MSATAPAPALPAPLDLDALASRYAGDALLDQVELRLLSVGGEWREVGGDLADFPLVHRFTPGLYIREIHMPAGSLVVSCTHRYESPYVISQGEASVWTEGGGWERFCAPRTGVTPAGTRRIVLNHTDVVWVGVFVNPDNERDLGVLERRYTYPRVRPAPRLVKE